MKMSRLAGPGAPARQYIGPVAEEQLGVQVAVRKIPSEAWFAAHPDGADEPPTDAEMVVQVVLMGALAYPSRLKHPANWDSGQFPVAELALVPYADWKGAADADIARKKGEPVKEDERPTAPSALAVVDAPEVG